MRDLGGVRRIRTRLSKGRMAAPLCRAELTPLGESGGAVLLEICHRVEAALRVEMIEDRGVDGDEHLQTSHAPKALHRSFSSSERQVRIFGPVVQPATCLMPVRSSDLLQRGAVGSKLVCYQDVRPT